MLVSESHPLRVTRAKKDLTIKYNLVLEHSDEGYSVSSPGLAGCWSHEAMEPEAIMNIRNEHVVMTDCARVLTLPRENPVKAATLAASRETPV